MTVLSVIMPIYNGEQYIVEALESVCCQKGNIDELELIIIDDGSTDRSMEIIKSYDHRVCIRCVKTERSGNWVTNTNLGITAAKGDYLCFLHQDDKWMAGRLAWIMKTIEQHPYAAVLFSSANFVSPSGHVLGRWSAPFGSGEMQELSSRDWFLPLLVQNYIAIPAPVFKRDVIIETMPMHHELKFTADWMLWLTLASQHSAMYNPVPTVCFRIHPSSQTCSITRDPVAYREQLMTVYRAFEKGLPDNSRTLRSRRAALLNVEVCLFLAAIYHHQRASLGSVLKAVYDAGWGGCLFFVKASRVWQRLSARLGMMVKGLFAHGCTEDGC